MQRAAFPIQYYAGQIATEENYKYRISQREDVILNCACHRDMMVSEE